MRIINIVDSVARVNYGIWHAAIVNAPVLSVNGIATELWYPNTSFEAPPHVTAVALASLSMAELEKLIQERRLDASKDIVITHGCWQYATRWGAALQQKGFAWMYVPQGMLEPWALQQKWLKKRLYFELIEKRLVKRAKWIRAVSMPETKNLKKLFPSADIRFIPNGVHITEELVEKKDAPRRYLFLSRLHAKKNVLALIAAWLQSPLNNDHRYELLIAGPDQGELAAINTMIAPSGNIKYIGSIYGAEKNQLLQQCTFYVLPSFSEGLPSAMLEAMSYGLVPIITGHCNLPEAFEQGVGIQISTDAADITQKLVQTAGWELPKIRSTGLAARQFVQQHYSLEAVTALQMNIFSTVFPIQQTTIPK